MSGPKFRGSIWDNYGNQMGAHRGLRLFKAFKGVLEIEFYFVEFKGVPAVVGLVSVEDPDALGPWTPFYSRP